MEHKGGLGRAVMSRRSHAQGEPKGRGETVRVSSPENKEPAFSSESRTWDGGTKDSKRDKQTRFGKDRITERMTFMLTGSRVCMRACIKVHHECVHIGTCNVCVHMHEGVYYECVPQMCVYIYMKVHTYEGMSYLHLGICVYVCMCASV